MRTECGLNQSGLKPNAMAQSLIVLWNVRYVKHSRWPKALLSDRNGSSGPRLLIWPQEGELEESHGIFVDAIHGVPDWYSKSTFNVLGVLQSELD